MCLAYRSTHFVFIQWACMQLGKERRARWKKFLLSSLLYRNAFKSYENVIYVQPRHFPKASLFSAVYSHYTNLSFVGLLCSTNYISRQPADSPRSLKRDFFPVAIRRQNWIANVCSNSKDTSWIMISSYGWLDAKEQQHVPQGGVAGSRLRRLQCSKLFVYGQKTNC